MRDIKNNQNLLRRVKMKNTKKLIVTLIAVVICLSVVLAFVGCDNPSNPSDPSNPSNPSNPTETKEFNITVWVSEVEGVKEMTQQQIERFNQTNEYGYKFVANIQGVSEADSATQMLTDVETGADIFCFAQDQTMRLVKAGALAPLGVKATETVTNNNDAGSVLAVTSGDKLYGYPLTSDNGYFMFYDKSIISEDIVDNFEALVDACAANNRKFSYELTSSAWYIASFFFGTGCTSTWTTDDDGKVVDFVDTFNSDKGLVALKGMQYLLQKKFSDGTTDVLNSSSAGADFDAAIPSAVLISGSWAANSVKEILGDNMGVTDLPSFTVDGQSYHLGSYSGNKLMGVKPQKDAVKAAALQQLALYLTNKDCQLERFDKFNWGPSNKEAQATDAVKSDVILSALAKQNEHSTPQGVIEGSWWEIGKALGVAAKSATTEDELKAALKKYKDALDDFKTDPQVWRLVGDFNNWTLETSIAFEQGENKIWTSGSVIEFADNSDFKIVWKRAWSNEQTQIDPNSAEYATSGVNGGNAKVIKGGKYTVMFDENTNLISFIPVE